MSKRLDETIGAVGFDNLINGQYPPAEVFTVKIRKEATEAKIYKRGTVLALSAGTAGDGLRVILGTTAKSNETLTANCVRRTTWKSERLPTRWRLHTVPAILTRTA